MKRADVWLISIVLIAALAFLAPRWFSDNDDKGGAGKNLVANVTVDGELFKTVKLTKKNKPLRFVPNVAITS